MHHANTAYCSLFGESKKKGSKACDQFTDGKVTRKPKKKEAGRLHDYAQDDGVEDIEALIDEAMRGILLPNARPHALLGNTEDRSR